MCLYPEESGTQALLSDATSKAPPGVPAIFQPALRPIAGAGNGLPSPQVPGATSRRPISKRSWESRFQKVTARGDAEIRSSQDGWIPLTSLAIPASSTGPGRKKRLAFPARHGRLSTASLARNAREWIATACVRQSSRRQFRRKQIPSRLLVWEWRFATAAPAGRVLRPSTISRMDRSRPRIVPMSNGFPLRSAARASRSTCTRSRLHTYTGLPMPSRSTGSARSLVVRSERRGLHSRLVQRAAEAPR